MEKKHVLTSLDLSATLEDARVEGTISLQHKFSRTLEILLSCVLPGGVLAAAWVALRIMGQDGYLKTAKTLMETTRKLIDGINSIPVSTFQAVLPEGSRAYEESC